MSADADPPAGSTPAVHVLTALADPARPSIDARRMALVVAHPDDETVSLGAQAHRLVGLRLVLVTDGAPRNLHDAKDHGFADAAAYAAARRAELDAALAAGDARRWSVMELGIPDQGAAHRLVEITQRLVETLGDVDVAFTHAHEGGHPDHDATAFAVHAAARILQRQGRGPAIVEMPFYRLGPDDQMTVQDFDPAADAVAVQLVLSPEEVERKARMVAAHRSQARTLARFPLRAERFRTAPHDAFDALPNGGRLLYERFDWGLTGPEWLRKVEAARRELGLADPDP